MSEPQDFVIEFRPSGRGQAQCAPNPLYPDGMDLNLAGGAQACPVALPYPAPECGAWLIRCTACQYTAVVTAAGRPDDPRLVCLPCKQPVAGDPGGPHAQVPAPARS